MVSHQRDIYNWEFIFLGANIDAWGIVIVITTNVNIQKDDLERSFKGTSLHVLCCRMEKMMFDPSESFDLTEGELYRKLKEFGKDQEMK
jgi:hypothetical protein